MAQADSIAPPAPVRGAQSIDRALALLPLVAQGHVRGVPLRELVARSGLDRTTAYRMLAALVRAGLVRRESGTLYRLGEQALALGQVALQRPPVLERCLPVMRALARRSGEPVFLVLRAGDHSHCLHQELGPRPVRSFADTAGSLRLLGLGVPSFAFLAHMDDGQVAAHHARHAAEYAAHRLSLPKMLRWVEQTRAQGHVQINAQGIGGVGMRFVLGASGEAALGIVAPASRLPRARGPQLVELLREEMRRL